MMGLVIILSFLLGASLAIIDNLLLKQKVEKIRREKEAESKWRL